MSGAWSGGPSTTRRALMVVGATLVVLGLVSGGWCVVAMESHELEYVAEWQRLSPSPDPTRAGKLLPHHELGRVKLSTGEDVTFEVCAQDRLESKQWSQAGIELAVWIPARQKIMVRMPLDEESLATATRSDDGACLIIAQGSGLTESGEFAIEAFWAGRDGELPLELRRVPFRARVLAFRASRPADRWPVVVILCGAVLFLLGIVRRKTNPVESDERVSDPVLDELGY
jgi:hypothetical protein